MASTVVGWIGLGNAGMSMASNLANSGFKLIVRDADSDRQQNFAKTKAGTVEVGNTPEAFSNADIIVTMLPNGKVVRDVLLGHDGIAPALKRGTVIVETSSSSPFDTRRLGEELDRYGLHLVDSPVTQTRLHDIDTGQATLMVGSNSSEAIAKITPVLQAMAKHVFHMGKLGAGHAMKTLNNYISAAAIVALSDSLVVGQKFGLDPVQMIDVLNVGTGRNFSTSDSYASDALPRKYASGYQLALLIKDIGIAKEVFEDQAFSTGLPDLILNDFSQAMSILKPDADHTELLKSWEKRAGIQLKSGQPCGDTEAKADVVSSQNHS